MSSPFGFQQVSAGNYLRIWEPDFLVWGLLRDKGASLGRFFSGLVDVLGGRAGVRFGSRLGDARIYSNFAGLWAGRGALGKTEGWTSLLGGPLTPSASKQLGECGRKLQAVMAKLQVSLPWG